VSPCQSFFTIDISSPPLHLITEPFIVTNKISCEKLFEVIPHTLSLIDSKNLHTLREWRPNTKYYVTCACEALIQNELGFYAIDIKGNLYSSTVSHAVLNINERVWGMTSNNFSQEILLVTINGSVIRWRGGDEISIVKNFDKDSPTACYHITHRNKLLVGFSSGKIELC